MKPTIFHAVLFALKAMAMACGLMCVAVAVAQDRYPRVLFFHCEACGPCKAALSGPNQFPEWLKRAGWQVDETTRAHVQLVSTDERDDLKTKYSITLVPAMVLLKDERTVGKPVVYSGRESLVSMFR